MTTEEIANEILMAWHHTQNNRNWSLMDSFGYKKVCEVIERAMTQTRQEAFSDAIDHDQGIVPTTDAAPQAVACSPATMPPNDLIRLLREQLSACARVTLTPLGKYPTNYEKLTDCIAALRAVDDLEKMPAIVDASIPF
jgi:hypothetical protein